jgi:hypothetical protein
VVICWPVSAQIDVQSAHPSCCTETCHHLASSLQVVRCNKDERGQIKIVRLCHFATISYTPTTTRLATSGLCVRPCPRRSADQAKGAVPRRSQEPAVGVSRRRGAGAGTCCFTSDARPTRAGQSPGQQEQFLHPFKPNTVQRVITMVCAKVFCKGGRWRCCGRVFFHLDIFRLTTRGLMRLGRRGPC